VADDGSQSLSGWGAGHGALSLLQWLVRPGHLLVRIQQVPAVMARRQPSNVCEIDFQREGQSVRSELSALGPGSVGGASWVGGAAERMALPATCRGACMHAAGAAAAAVAAHMCGYHRSGSGRAAPSHAGRARSAEGSRWWRWPCPAGRRR
jgi:hypothetical protein